MIDPFDSAAFKALFPFSFLTDQFGVITLTGESLHKVVPSLKVGQHFLAALELLSPPRTDQSVEPATLIGDYLVLHAANGDALKLRGQVVRCSKDSNNYLFALDLSVSDPHELSALGLTISDFRVGDPIFDFLLYVQGQRTAQEKLREAKASLEWENRFTKLLLSIALETQNCTAEHDVYQRTITAICRALEWDIGHVYSRHDGASAELSSINAWEVRDPQRFESFISLSTSEAIPPGSNLLGRTPTNGKVIWIPDIMSDETFSRRAALSSCPHLTAVGVPVTVEGVVVAILELFTEQRIPNPRTIYRFFELLALQLSSTVARVRATTRERQQIAALASASKMATLGEIAAGVAHEINNPLQTLFLVGSLIRRLLNANKLTDGLLLEQLEKVDACTKRMRKIVLELRDFSRDATHDTPEFITIKKLIEDTLDLCHARLTTKNVSVNIAPCPDSWEIECRPSQISQVLLNLLNNAFDAVAELDERWITIQAHERRDTFEISVTDSGHGIPPEVASRITTPFFTTKPAGKGTGLGLSISSNIMVDHGGSLTLDSSSPNTRFVITLPKSSPQVHLSGRDSCGYENPLPLQDG